MPRGVGNTDNKMGDGDRTNSSAGSEAWCHRGVGRGMCVGGGVLTGACSKADDMVRAAASPLMSQVLLLPASSNRQPGGWTGGRVGGGVGQGVTVASM